MPTASTIDRAPVKPLITPELLDQLADRADLSEEARDAVDQTIVMVLHGISIAADGIVHKRNAPEENTSVPRPPLPDNPMSIYILACLSRQLSDSEQPIKVLP